MKKFLLILLLSFVNCLWIHSVHPIVRNFSKNTYQAGTQNWGIAQQNNHWMYFANNNGLLQFDGNNWSLFPILNFTDIRSVYIDKETSRIYAGAFDEFGFYHKDNSSQLVYTSLVNNMKLKSQNFREVWNISKSTQAVFFQADYNVFKYSNDSILSFNFKNKIDKSAIVHNTFFVSAFADGVKMLVGDIFINLPGSDILKNKRVCSILPFDGDDVLFVTDVDGLFIFNGSTIKPYKMDIDEILKSNQVFCAGIENEILAFGTVKRGLVIKNLKTGHNTFVNTSNGLQNNTVLSMSFDNQHNIWLGLDKGVSLVIVNSPIYELLESGNQYGAGYTSLIKGNILYLGTNQGLYYTKFPLTTNLSFIQLNPVNGVQGQVWDLKEIDNTVFCSNDRGLYTISGTNSTQILGLRGTLAVKPYPNHPNTIIGSSYDALFILQKQNNQWVLSHRVKGSYETSGQFEIDEFGQIWLSKWLKGIYRLTLTNTLDSVKAIQLFDSNQGFPSSRNNTIYNINNHFVFSSEYGFYTYNSSHSSMDRYDFLDQLFGRKNALRLFIDRNENIWAVSRSFFGVGFKQKDNSYKLDTISLKTLSPKLISGYQHINFVDSNHVIVGTEDGFSWLDLTKIDNSLQASPLLINKIYSTNLGDSLIGYQYLDTNTKAEKAILFKLNSLRFEFEKAEYRAENAIEYSYLLENFDKNWSSYNRTNTKEYTKLPKGTYTFRVRAKSIFETEISEASFTFTISPPWYESIVAIIIYLLLFIVAMIFMTKYATDWYNKRVEKMQLQKEVALKEQEDKFREDTKVKEQEIIKLKNQKLENELKHKAQELASSTMNLIRKNEILLEISEELGGISKQISDKNDKNQERTLIQQITGMQKNIKENIKHDNEWRRFEENFDIVYENYLTRLVEKYPSLSAVDKRICAYLKMNLSSKDIAPLLNMTVRSVEMNRYRIRKKMNLDRQDNLTEFLQKF